MKRTTKLGMGLPAVFAFSIVWAVVSSAHATHFRYGYMFWKTVQTDGPPTDYPGGTAGIQLVGLDLTSVRPPLLQGPLPEPGDTHDLGSFFDVFTELSIDGQPYTVDSFFDITYRVTGTGGGTFDTEMLAMSLTGQIPGGPNVHIRESPTRPSLGRIVVSDLPTGQFHIDSFFDVFTEISLDGGPYLPAGGSTRLVLTGWTPEPGTMTLALLGSLAFIRRHRSRQEAVVGPQGTGGNRVN